MTGRWLVVVAIAGTLPAQQGAPFVPLDGVVNNASYLPACAPGGGVAPGSVFAVFGRDIGPAALAQVSAFPLRTSLEDVSARVTMNGASYDAWPLYANATQVGAVLPSVVPPGDGTLTVTYRGRSADPVPIRVRAAAPGLFTTNQRGTGLIVGTSGALRPGEIGTIWATGLGAVPGDEAGGPLPSDRPALGVRVWVGDRLARVIYRGRSGCCAGLDQIAFEVPAGIEGCQVPISVEAAGVTSNFGSIAIAASGRCAATPRPPPVSVNKFGLIFFLDGYGSIILPTASDDYVRLGFFQSGRVEGDLEPPLYAFEPNAEMPVNSCTVRYGTEFPAQPSQPQQTPLDAGPELRVSGPGGTFSLLRNAGTGSYEDARRVVIPPGRYTVANGGGGRDVGPFSFDAATVSLGLISRPERITRRDDYTLTWDYLGPSDQLLTIFGSSNSCGRALMSFTCTVRAADRRFTIPARILSALPASTSFFGLSNGALNISTTTPGGLQRFTAPGLDLGLFLQLSISSIRLFYE